MDLFFYILWEIVVDFLDISFFCYLLYRKLTPKEVRFPLFPVLIPIMTLLLGTMNLIGLPSLVTLLLTLFMELGSAILFFQNEITKKIFIGISGILIDILSENLTIFIASLFLNQSLDEVLELGTVRFVISLIYLLTAGLFFFAASHISFSRKELPTPIKIILIFMIIMDIIIADSILGMIIALESRTQLKNPSLILGITGFSFFLSLFVLIYMIWKLADMQYKNLTLLEENTQKENETKQLQIITEAVENLRSFRHDYTTQIEVIKQLTSQGNQSALMDYINQLANHIESSNLVSSGNPVIDAVLSAKLLTTQRFQIHMEYNIFLPPSMPLTALDLSTLIGNLTDNAIDACKKFPVPSKTSIQFILKPVKEMLSIRIRNSSDGKYNFDHHKHLTSTKSGDNHGYGLKKIIKIVESSNGFIQISPEPDYFQILIMIPLETKL